MLKKLNINMYIKSFFGEDKFVRFVIYDLETSKTLLRTERIISTMRSAMDTHYIRYNQIHCGPYFFKEKQVWVNLS